MTGDLDLGANNRVLFGTANDLQIYHSGAAKISNSTGQLDINSTAGITLEHTNATKLATATTGITITGKATSTATVAGDGATTLTTKGYVDGLASDVTSVNSGTPFDSTGAPLAISPTSGAVIVSSAIYNGGTNIGVVPDGGTATTFLKGDGNWATPSGGYTTERVGASTTVSAVKDYLYILANPSTVTITLPASPADGDTIGIANNFVASGGNITNQLVAPGTGGNTDLIMGAIAPNGTPFVIDNGSAAFDLVFSSAGAPTGNGWTIIGAN